MHLLNKINFLLRWIWLTPLFSFGQTDTSKATFKITGFLDTYYSYDLAKPTTNFKQAFYFNHNRQNQIAVNLGILQLDYSHPLYRAKMGIHGGTYVQDNYSAEPLALKYFSEASVGFRLSKKRNFWLDAGIFPSHIGFESAISADNPILTRSLIAENSPYFNCGAKLFYSPKESWEFSILALNGWQRIQRSSDNSMLSFGSQITHIREKVKFNYSTFFGTDDPDSLRRLRLFNNLYAQFTSGEKWIFIVGFDFGIQQETKSSNNFNTWFGAALITRYQMNEHWSFNARLEMYDDRDQVIVPTGTTNGYNGLGGSLGVEYKINSMLLWRIEGRYLNSLDYLYQGVNGFSQNNSFITSSIALKFDTFVR